MSDQTLNQFITEEAERMAKEADVQDTAEATPSDQQVSSPADNAPEPVSTTGEEVAPKEAEAQPAQAAEQLEAPKHWDAADKEAFSKMPREAQQWALRRDKQIEATITKKTQELAEQRKAVEPLLSAQQQHMSYLQSIGVSPDVAFSTLVATERLLRTGTPEQKSAAIAKLISDYGISFDTNTAAPQQITTNPPVDTHLHTEVQHLRSSIQEMERQHVENQVEAFANAKSPEGHLLRPHFEKVCVKMGQMVAGGDTRSLDDLYAEAIWSVPEVREEMLESQRKAAATAQTEAAREAAAKARQASSVNVKPSNSTGTAKAKLPLREEIMELARQQA